MDKLIAISANGFFAIMALHWLPWGKLLGRELPRPVSYIIGVATIGVTYTAWLAWARPMWGQTIIGFCVVVAAIGLGDLAAYLIDDWGGGRMDRRIRGRTPERGIERD